MRPMQGTGLNPNDLKFCLVTREKELSGLPSLIVILVVVARWWFFFLLIHHLRLFFGWTIIILLGKCADRDRRPYQNRHQNSS